MQQSRRRTDGVELCMRTRRNKLGMVTVHEGCYVMLPTDHTAICRGRGSSAITSAPHQEVFAAAKGSIAIAEAQNSRAYATVEGATARAYGRDTLAVAMSKNSRAFANKKGARAIATVLGAQAHVDVRGGNSVATATQDFLQCVYPTHRKDLRLTVT